MSDQPGPNPTGQHWSSEWPASTGYAGPPPTGYVPPQPVDPYAGAQAPAWGHPPQQYPGSYGPPVPPGYSGFAPTPAGDRRLGTVLASAVLGYINAGFLILMSVILFSTTSIVDDLSRYAEYHNSGLSTEFAIDAFVNLVAAGLLIAGAISMTNRNTLGRRIYSVGAIVVLAESVYWLARWSTREGGGYITPYPLMFIAVAVIGLCLAWMGGASAWFSRAAAGPRTADSARS